MDFVEVGEKGYSFWLPREILETEKKRIVYSFGQFLYGTNDFLVYIIGK